MLKIKSIKMSDKDQNHTRFDYDEMPLHDINLIIGPNASGKSQFFARLKYLRTLHRKSNPTQNLQTTFYAHIVFQDEEGQEKIHYQLKAGPGELVHETIKSDSRDYLIHDGEESKLLNEKTNETQVLLANKRQSITKQIEDRQNSFPTIFAIGNFFENILFLDADKFNPNAVMVGPDQFVPSDQMENISSVVINWKNQYPNLYNLLLKEYKTFFPYVEEFSQIKMQVAHGIVDMLAVKEKNVVLPTLARDMSSGMLRILCLLALPMSRHLAYIAKEWSSFSPSMIVIDEIDNGLDYENISAIIEYLEAEASFSQIVFSSHSPVMCNFISLEKWHIFRRRDSKVKVTNPSQIEATKDLIEKARMSNWEIYKNHIAHSPLYSVQ